MSHDWCETCRERTTLDVVACPFCDTPLTTRRGGWKRPDRQANLTDDQLRLLYRLYVGQRLSMRKLAAQIWQKAGYASEKACATSICNGFQRLGLPARDRIQATRLANTVHGLSPKHGKDHHAYGLHRKKVNGWHSVKGPGRPRCEALRSQYPNKGARCQCRAMEGSVFCWAHDPERKAEHAERLARARARRPVPVMVPVGPFSAWLLGVVAAQGSLVAAARFLGVDRSIVQRYVNGTPAVVGAATVRRYAERAGTSVEAIYGDQERVA